MLSQQDRNKEDAGVILDGGRVMPQEEENLSLSRTREFVRMLSVLCSGRGLPSVLCEEQFPILFPASMSVLWRKSRLPMRGCQIWLSFVPLPKCLTMSSGQLKSKQNLHNNLIYFRELLELLKFYLSSSPLKVVGNLRITFSQEIRKT